MSDFVVSPVFLQNKEEKPQAPVSQKPETDNPELYDTVDNPHATYSSQSNALTEPQDTPISQRARVLKASDTRYQKLMEYASAGGSSSSAGIQADQGGAGGLVPQIYNEHIQVTSASTARPLVQAAPGGAITGDDRVTQSLTAATKTHGVVSHYLGRDFQFRDGKRLDIRIDKTMESNEQSPAGYLHTGNNPQVGITADMRETAKDPDVISHETGHAILDSQRPEYDHQTNYLLTSPEKNQVQEEFADTTALFTALNDKEVSRKVISSWERGERSTVASRIAEGGNREFAELERKLGAGDTRTPGAQEGMRDISQRPKPEGPAAESSGAASLDDLFKGQDPHKQAFSSGVYNSVYDIYTQMRAENPTMPKEVAFIKARDAVGSDFSRTLDFLPAARGSQVFTSDLCNAMMKADTIDNGGRYREIYAKNFRESGIDMNLTASLTKAQEAWTGRLGENPALALPAGLRTGREFLRTSGNASPGGDEASSTAMAQRYFDENREALGMPPGVKMSPQQLYHNDRGETFIAYSGGGHRYDTQSMESVILGFDRKGRIIHSEGNLTPDAMLAN
ncbi:MAG: hypothetical protein RDV48_25570 [Candidatus Eremiobacteraeota bacterium]|nr:hypothetical protein [Candidatus Eremiobacteraeota bacterium]